MKSTALTFAKVKPFVDYKIGKLEILSDVYDVTDPFFINDSIAEKIVDKVYAVPEIALKLIKNKKDDLEGGT